MTFIMVIARLLKEQQHYKEEKVTLLKYIILIMEGVDILFLR